MVLDVEGVVFTEDLYSFKLGESTSGSTDVYTLPERQRVARSRTQMPSLEGRLGAI